MKKILIKTAVAFCILSTLTGCGSKQKEKVMEKTTVLAADVFTGLATKPAADVRKEIQENVKDLTEEDQSQETDNPPDFSVETPAAYDVPDENLYESFLKGQVAATVHEDYLLDSYFPPYPLEKGKSYTLDGLGKWVNYNYLELSTRIIDKTSYDDIQYAYIGCLDGDKKNLLISFDGLDIYCDDDNSYTVMAVTAQEGRLYITYQYDNWPRCYAYAYTKGQIADVGSGGAGDHVSDLSVILSNGICKQISSIRSLNDEWISNVNEEIYRKVFHPEYDINLASGADWLVTITTVGDEKYYQYDVGEEASETQNLLFQQFINRCREKASIDWVSDEVVQEAIENRCVQLGFHYEDAKDFVEAEWISLPSDGI